MPSTSAPSDPAPAELAGPPAPVRVWHYDGLSGVRREPLLVTDGARFTLSDLGGETGPFAFADLEPRDAVGGAAIYGLKRSAGWRIGFPGGVPAELAARLARPTRYGVIIDRFGLWPAAGVSAVLACIVVAVFLQTPAMVARAVPASVERQLGDVMTGDFGNRRCDAPGGEAALRALVERIDPGDAAVSVEVVNLPVVNAVTLPGGHIVLFDGLVQAARSPDEVAGVLAHELGHVRHRDVLESLLRHVGLSVLLGGLDGQVGGYTNALLSSAYSREAEARADGFAIDALAQAQVSPAPIAQFFTRLSKQEGGPAQGVAQVATYFASHPMSGDRARRFVAATRAHHADRAALDATQWLHLRTICSADPNVAKPGFDF